MKHLTIAIIFFLSFLRVQGQVNRVLIFFKTESYIHVSIPSGIEAIKILGRQNNFSVDTTKDAKVFSDENLRKYAAVIFLSPTGDVLDTTEKAAFRRYIQAGGGYLGIHAASTAEKSWPWYGQLVGAVFTGHPEPQDGIIRIANTEHAATRHLPEEWEWRDEWYNFDFRAKDLKILLLADEQTYKGGTNGKYHPLAWYHEFDGGRSFYTALGHFPEAYQDPMFLKHLSAGIRYAIGENVQLDYSRVK